MKIAERLDDSRLVEVLEGGGLAVIRTDTIYGIVARADDEQAVERVYQLKGRNQNKSPIILIADQSQLYDEVGDATRALVGAVWPGKVSLILPSTKAPSWIRRANDSVAYRLPESSALVDLLAQTGPLVAPSANPEGSEPALDIRQAIEYFQDAVDIYVDQGTVVDNHPSQLLRVTDEGTIERLR